jgi:uncharacterized protein
MTRFGTVAFTKEIRALQERYRSRTAYAKVEANESGDPSFEPDEIEFIESRDSFFLSTVTSDGWPYIQHRGGPRGFLRALGRRTLGFADYSGNKQYISLGNLQTDDRVAMILMDYPSRGRLKILGHARVVEPESDAQLTAVLRPLEEYRAKVERFFVVSVVAWDWNCERHITPRYTLEEIERLIPDE